MSLSLWIGALLIPVAVLLVDAGRRKLTLMRIARPFLITAVIVPFVMPGFDLQGRGLLLEIVGIVVGALLGLAASALMKVEYDGGSRMVMTVAGAPYVLIWGAVSAARTLFAYEAEESVSFQRSLGEFLVSNHISPAALADAIMFLGFAMLIAQRGSLFLRSRRLTPAAVSAA
ncbi:hypothetical protein [Microtetraspora malaysiensis]|uniref:hypothetical protein n=1 Tax=Microtetraspora malaysiensis TaxID=161358 RepID=UPI003D8CC8A1